MLAARSLSVAAVFLLAAGTLGAQGRTVACNDGTFGPAAQKDPCAGHRGVKRDAGAVKVNAPPVRGSVAVVAPTDARAKPAKGQVNGGIIAPTDAHAKPAKAGIIGPSMSRTASPRDPGNSSKTGIIGPSMSGAAPTDASAKCNDGTYSKATHRTGACAGHKGVASWLQPNVPK